MSEKGNIVERLTATLDQLRQCTAWKGFAAPQTDVRVKSPAYLIEDLGDALAEIASLRAQLAEEKAKTAELGRLLREATALTRIVLTDDDKKV